MEILICLIPLIIIQVILLLKKEKVDNLIHILFCGLLSIIFSIVIGTVINTIIPIEQGSLLYGILIGGITEEICKFIAFKLTGSKTNRQILLSCIYIGLVFRILESILYAETEITAITRTLTSGHVLYQTIMAIFLIKAKNNPNKKGSFTTLAIITPIIIHSIFNSGINEIINDNMTYSIIYALIIYSITIIAIFKIKNTQYDTQVVTKKKSIIGNIFKVFTLIVFIFLVLISSQKTKIGDTKILFSENLEVTINNVEKDKEEDVFADTEIDIINIDLTIKNNKDTDFKINMFEWNLVNEKTGDTKLLSKSNDEIIIKKDEEKEITLIFEIDDYKDWYLTYKPINSSTSYNFILKN